MNRPRVLIKVGGAALVDSSVLDSVAQAVQQFRNEGVQVVIVHGGGPAINAELTRRGISWNFLNGQRVTTPEMMGVIETTLCGQVNRELVRHLGAHGIPTVGFSGVDNQTLQCVPVSIELGLVGAVQTVNSDWIEELIDGSTNLVPVIAPIGVGKNGEAYNINADWAASYLAAALGAQHLLFLTDQMGILNPAGELIRSINQYELQALIDRAVVTGGMLTKTNAILYALKNGVHTVRVLNGKDAAIGRKNELTGTWCSMTSPHEVLNYAAV